MSERKPYDAIYTESFRRSEASKDKREFRELEPAVYQGHTREEFGDYIESVQSLEAKEAFNTACVFAEQIQDAGGKALLVGGSVRDEVLGKASKDFDIEVYGLAPEAIEKVASTIGRIDTVGRSFGILKIFLDSGFDLDISLPRTDSKIDVGHKGFRTEVDPQMSVAEAAKRRDFTFNALAKNPLSGEIFDYYGGVEDLRSRTLKVTDQERFQDDPLRLLRAAQFVGRFGMRVDPNSMEVMRGMVNRLAELPKERIKEEWDKLLLRAQRPSMGLQMLFDAGVIDAHYPELAALYKTPQEFEWHPEGDTWVHTLMVVDAAANTVNRHQLSGTQARIVMYGALCHDLGKPLTTKEEQGRIRSRGHEPAGDPPTRNLLTRLGQSAHTIDAVSATVREHLWPSVQFLSTKKGADVSDGAVRRLAKRIHPATISDLTYVAEADHFGRGPFLDKDHSHQFLLPDPYAAGKWLRDRAVSLGVYEEVPKSLIRGQDLIELGFKPGKDFGEIIRLADAARDDLGTTREGILALLGACEHSRDAIHSLQELT